MTDWSNYPDFSEQELACSHCKKYMDKVAAGEITDILPTGKLDELKVQLETLKE